MYKVLIYTPLFFSYVYTGPVCECVDKDYFKCPPGQPLITNDDGERICSSTFYNSSEVWGFHIVRGPLGGVVLSRVP